MLDKDLLRQIIQFRDDRKWKQFHNPKDLAISISIEAAELLENFQWSGADNIVSRKALDIEEELADVLIYCALMADSLNLDMDEIVHKKLKKMKNIMSINLSEAVRNILNWSSLR